MSILPDKEELGTEESPADVTLDAFLDAFEAEKLVSEVPTVEPELMTVSDMMKQLRLVQRSTMTKEIEGWDSLEDALFHLQGQQTASTDDIKRLLDFTLKLNHACFCGFMLQFTEI